MTTQMFDPTVLSELLRLSSSEFYKDAFMPPGGDPAAQGGMSPGGDPAAQGGMPPGGAPPPAGGAPQPAPPTVLDPSGMGGMPPQQPAPAEKKKFDPAILHAEVYQIKQLLLGIYQQQGLQIPGKALMTNAPDPAMQMQAEQQFQQQDAQASMGMGGVAGMDPAAQGGMPPGGDPAAAGGDPMAGGMPKAGNAPTPIGYSLNPDASYKATDDAELSSMLSDLIAGFNKSAEIAAALPEPQPATYSVEDMAEYLRSYTCASK